MPKGLKGFAKENKIGNRFQKGNVSKDILDKALIGRKKSLKWISAMRDPELRKQRSERMKGKDNPIRRPEVLAKVRNARIGKKLVFKDNKLRSKRIGDALRGRRLSLEERAKQKGKQESVYQKILHEIPELERQGYVCIPITKVVPDIIAVKDGKIYAIEVEYGVPNYEKYNKENYKKYFADIIWLLRKNGKK